MDRSFVLHAVDLIWRIENKLNERTVSTFDDNNNGSCFANMRDPRIKNQSILRYARSIKFLSGDVVCVVAALYIRSEQESNQFT